MSNIAHELEDRIMDCWSVTSDIKVAYEEYLDSPEPMDEDELSNILIGIEYLYNRKFQKLWQTFEEVCDHGGIWLDKDLVKSAKQHKDLIKVRNVPDRLYNNVKKHNAEFPTKEDIQAANDKLRNKFSDPPDEYNDETQEDINKDWEKYVQSSVFL
jgi:hypothetical protein